jgi:hypothetical protein
MKHHIRIVCTHPDGFETDNLTYKFHEEDAEAIFDRMGYFIRESIKQGLNVTVEHLPLADKDDVKLKFIDWDKL